MEFNKFRDIFKVGMERWSQKRTGKIILEPIEFCFDYLCLLFNLRKTNQNSLNNLNTEMKTFLVLMLNKSHFVIYYSQKQ